LPSASQLNLACLYLIGSGLPPRAVVRTSSASFATLAAILRASTELLCVRAFGLVRILANVRNTILFVAIDNTSVNIVRQHFKGH